MHRNLQICSLPTEILYAILKSLLNDIVERDMITSPEPQHRVLSGGLPFPNTMALVCRHWRDIVLSAPGLWTRIFYVIHLPTQLTLSSQLKKTGSYPIDLTISSSRGDYSSASYVLPSIEQHIRRLRSLRIKAWFYQEKCSFTKLPAYAPWLECLHLESTLDPDDLKRLFSVHYPAIRILHLDGEAASTVDPQWGIDNLTHVESVTLSNVDGSGVLRALSSISRRIPCLTVKFLRFLPISLDINSGSKIKAATVTLCYGTVPLAMINDHCKTIVLHLCMFPVEPQKIPCSSTLELDQCFGSYGSINLEWDGDAVVIMNSNFPG